MGRPDYDDATAGENPEPLTMDADVTGWVQFSQNEEPKHKAQGD